MSFPDRPYHYGHEDDNLRATLVADKRLSKTLGLEGAGG